MIGISLGLGFFASKGSATPYDPGSVLLIEGGTDKLLIEGGTDAILLEGNT